ncbi:hypothetical protein VTO73DRAFT_1331 [Trametes versicolor]
MALSYHGTEVWVCGDIIGLRHTGLTIRGTEGVGLAAYRACYNLLSVWARVSQLPRVGALASSSQSML